MSIVIDDDDDLICTTDNAIETVYADDALLTEFIANELKPHEAMGFQIGSIYAASVYWSYHNFQKEFEWNI